MLGMSSMGPSLALALPNPSPARPSCESGLEFRWWNTCDWVKVLSPAEGAGDHARLHRREATKGPTPDYWGGQMLASASLASSGSSSQFLLGKLLLVQSKGGIFWQQSRKKVLFCSE